MFEKDINLIPLTDENHKIVDYINWEKAFGIKNEITKINNNIPVVIMAGGKGTRLDPFTRILPKPLIPINGKPIIEYIIDKFYSYGLQEYYLITNHKSKIIKAYFEENEADYNIHLFEENEPLGTAGGLKLLINHLKVPFFISNCDILISADYSDIYKFHQEGDYEITLLASLKQYQIPYGICELNGGGHLKQINEKPEYNFLVNTGMYVVNPKCIELIREGGIYHITTLISEIIDKGGKIGVYPVSEDAWIDIGQWAEYKKALSNIEFKAEK